MRAAIRYALLQLPHDQLDDFFSGRFVEHPNQRFDLGTELDEVGGDFGLGRVGRAELRKNAQAAPAQPGAACAGLLGIASGKRARVSHDL